MNNEEKLREIRANLVCAQKGGPLLGELLTDVIASIDRLLESGSLSEEPPREVKPAPEPPPPDECDATGR